MEYENEYSKRTLDPIIMARGNLEKIPFFLEDEDGNILDLNLDEMIVSFKNNFNETNCLFQKKLSENQITKDEENIYTFNINPEDTEDLDFTNYVYIIKLIKDDSIVQSFVGDVVITYA